MPPFAGIIKNSSRNLSSELAQRPSERPLAEPGYRLSTTSALSLVKISLAIATAQSSSICCLFTALANRAYPFCVGRGKVWEGVKVIAGVAVGKQASLPRSIMQCYAERTYQNRFHNFRIYTRGCFSFNLTPKAAVQPSKRASNSMKPKLPPKLGGPAITDAVPPV